MGADLSPRPRISDDQKVVFLLQRGVNRREVCIEGCADTVRLCIVNFRSRLGYGDRFDDWGVGRQFVPDYLSLSET